MLGEKNGIIANGVSHYKLLCATTIKKKIKPTHFTPSWVAYTGVGEKFERKISFKNSYIYIYI